jgi:5-aminopentanamidase
VNVRKQSHPGSRRISSRPVAIPSICSSCGCSIGQRRRRGELASHNFHSGGHDIRRGIATSREEAASVIAIRSSGLGYPEPMKVAAYEAPLLAAGSMDALDLMQERVAWCEAEGVSILCCPEAILGGLADYSENPARLAIRTDNAQLDSVLAPLASNTVTSIVGFTELASNGEIFNAAAVFHRGRVAGVYRKIHPAVRRSVYAAGSETPVFRVGELTFGIVVCNDSNYSEPARLMVVQGATALFIPTNNGLPNERAYAELVEEARNADIDRAVENGIWVIRADVAGQNGELMSYGASGIVDPDGNVLQQAKLQSIDVLVADIETSPRARQRGSEAVQ